MGFWLEGGPSRKLVVPRVRGKVRAFSLWEGFALLFCCMAAFYRKIFPDFSRGTLWALFKWLLLDGPGIVTVLSGLDGELGPLIAQLLLEVVLVCAEKRSNQESEQRCE